MAINEKKENISGGDIRIFPPIHDCAPRLDDVVTSTRPVLSWLNSGGISFDERNYVLQLDTSPFFNTKNFM